MSNETKKFAGLESLQAFLDGCKTLFANITHKHTMSDITDYTVDSELSSESTNPVQNAVLTAELNAIKENKSDWNENDSSSAKYIENRTHWVEQGKEVLLEELNVSNWNILNDYNQDIENIHINIGSEYIVTVDGVQYRCIGYEGYTGEWCLGDERVSGASEFTDDYHSEDVPFFIGSYENEGEMGMNGLPIVYCEWYVCFPDEETHTIKIEKESDEIEYHSLDERFIPDTIARKTYVDETFALKSDIKDVDLSGYETKEDAQLKYDTITNAKADWSQNDINAIDYIKNRTHWIEVSTEVICQEQSITGGEWYTLDGMEEVLSTGTIFVTLDGIKYECQSWHNEESTICYGNGAIVGGIYANHEENTPFLINWWIDAGLGFSETYVWEVIMSDTATHTIKIETIGTDSVYHTIDERFIPNSIARTNAIDAKMNISNPTGNGRLTMNKHPQGTSGDYSTTLGYYANASGEYSYAEGFYTTASGQGSHVEGNSTIASSDYQHVQGRYNIKDTSNKYAHIVGNGYNSVHTSNAHTLDWYGNAWYAGIIKVGGTSYDDASEVALKSDLESIDLSEYATTIYVDSTFAKKSDVQDVDLSNYYTKPEIDNLELITVDDIDAICGGSIQYAEEVLF